MAQVFDDLFDPRLVEMIHNGAVGVVPSDTVYGLAASAAIPEAVAKMYALKQREQKPGPTIAASIRQLLELGINQSVIDPIAELWPAPLSIILPVTGKLSYLHQGLGDSPFRIVADERIQKMLYATGPLVTTSANQPGKPPATRLAEAQAYFGNRVDFYVNDGILKDRQPSTIVRLTPSRKLEIIRQGELVIPPTYQI